jgi:hypothetical protein
MIIVADPQKFMNDHCIDTYRSFLSSYAELRPEQIKRVLVYFHRVFVKRKQQVILLRLDICELLSRMVNDEINIPNSSSIRAHLEDFVKHYTHVLTKALAKTPILFVEVIAPSYCSEDSFYSPNCLDPFITFNMAMCSPRLNQNGPGPLQSWKYVQGEVRRIRLLWSHLVSWTNRRAMP